MSTSLKNLSEYDKNSMPDATGLVIGIAVSEWNFDITNALLEGALKTLKDNGVQEDNIHVHHVPGSFELPLAAKIIIENDFVDAVICIGCVIQGETRHFEFICDAVSQGIMRVNLDTHTPVVFGVLTTDNLEQAKERSGRTHGNKGVEAAITAIKMASLKNNMEDMHFANSDMDYAEDDFDDDYEDDFDDDFDDEEEIYEFDDEDEEEIEEEEEEKPKKQKKTTTPKGKAKK